RPRPPRAPPPRAPGVGPPDLGRSIHGGTTPGWLARRGDPRRLAGRAATDRALARAPALRRRAHRACVPRLGPGRQPVLGRARTDRTPGGAGVVRDPPPPPLSLEPGHHRPRSHARCPRRAGRDRATRTWNAGADRAPWLRRRSGGDLGRRATAERLAPRLRSQRDVPRRLLLGRAWVWRGHPD